MKFVISVLLVVVAVVAAQNDGSYRPFGRRPVIRPTVTIRPIIQPVPFTAGRYSTESRYVDRGNDGRYRPSDDGKYHPDNSGQYAGDNGRYEHVDVRGGQYSGDSNPYRPDAGGKYAGDGGAGGAGGAGTGGDYRPTVTPTRRPVVVAAKPIVAAPAPAVRTEYANDQGLSTLGVPSGLKQGSAAGKYDNRNYAIIRQVMNNEEDGYHYLYETENGILAEEQGKIENKGSDAEGMRAHGFFTYTGPDAIEYTVTYTADENGFIPVAAHLPQAPAIPPLIARALAYKESIGDI